jgi:hypothetical protein
MGHYEDPCPECLCTHGHEDKCSIGIQQKCRQCSLEKCTWSGFAGDCPLQKMEKTFMGLTNDDACFTCRLRLCCSAAGARSEKDKCPRYEAENVLAELFRLQAELNAKLDFKQAAANASDIYCGTWLNNYVQAIQSELEELKDCTFWKHWYKEAREGRRYAMKDRNKAKVEIVDLLFFWISLAQCIGLTVDEVRRLYKKKLEANHNRRDDNVATGEHKAYEIDAS